MDVVNIMLPKDLNRTGCSKENERKAQKNSQEWQTRFHLFKNTFTFIFINLTYDINHKNINN